ncbi:MAG: lipoprotein NlpI [Methanosaeta sp. PtaU1.Bin112]|nr:MAG: lipoprotein NlpI [Methanosaeta sp. PtaU1.Bin112]
MTDVERQYWLWVTRPDYYLDEDGCDREDLDPTLGADSDGWWTCNKATKQGDLVLLWRTSPKKDIRYLIQAESDAYSIADNNDHGWDYGCDYEVLYKFEHSLHVKDLRQNPYFDEWGPLRCSFQRSNFKISPEYWAKLNNLLALNNPGYQEFIEKTQRQSIAESIGLEKELEDALVSNLGILKNFGYNLELYDDLITNQSGRQFICKGNGGRIDLLCYDQTKKRYVVIELKNVRASQNTFGQISNYMGWVQDRIAKSVPVKGLVISRGYDTRFESALKTTDKIGHINVEELGFSVAPSIKAQKVIDFKNSDQTKMRIPKSREASKWVKKGDDLFDQGKYNEAISCYDNAIEKDPKNKLAWVNKGAALLELMESDDAISCFDKVTELYPKSAEAWNGKGYALNRLDRFDEAIIAFNKAIEINHKSADAWNGKGIALDNSGKHDDAIQAYERAIAIRPKFDEAWNNKGWALAGIGRSEEAIQAYDNAIAIDSKNPSSWKCRGNALADLGKHDEAVKAYDKALELDPKDAILWNNKGTALFGLLMYEEALEAFNKAIDINPQEAFIWHFRGETLKALNRSEEADAAFSKAKELGYNEE